MNSDAAPPDSILIADDNHDDVFLTRWVLDKVGIENPIVAVEDGQEAIALLDDCICTGNTPCVALLDLRMPKRNGFAVLEWMRSQPALASVRRIVLASSDLPEDRRRAAELGALAYFVKYDTASELPPLLLQCPRISTRVPPGPPQHRAADSRTPEAARSVSSADAAVAVGFLSLSAAPQSHAEARPHA